MNAKEILAELKALGSPATKKVLLKHGIREPFFGVKIGDIKKIQKRIKSDYQLALDLYDTGNYDAMYLAGMIADDVKMTKKGSEQLGGPGLLRRTGRLHGFVSRGRQSARL